jgi:hypothetical protein
MIQGDPLGKDEERMSIIPPAVLDRPLARVRWRLFLRALLRALAVGWIAGLVLSAAWLAAQARFLPESPAALRWQVPAGLLSVCTVLAAVAAVWRTPSPVGAALALDERFALKERVTTSLLLTDEERASPAGQALLADVAQRLQPVRVGERFPVRPPATLALVPVGALLVLLALFVPKPQPPALSDAKKPLTEDPAVAAAVEEKKKALLKRPQPKPNVLRPRSPELEQLRDAADRLGRQPTDTRDQARNTVEGMGALEEEMRKRDQDLAQKARALKEQLKQAERAAKKDSRKDPEGPGKGLQKALQDGDLQQARDEAERLAKQLDPDEEKDRLQKKKQLEEEADRLRKKLKDKDLAPEQADQLRRELEQKEKEIDRLQRDQLTEEQKQQLREQLQRLQENLDRLTQGKKEQEELLREQQRQGKLTAEELQRELEQLNRNLEKLDPETLAELKKIADELGECKQCLGEGQDGAAARKLQEAADRLAKLDPNGERAELAREIARLQAARRALCQALEGNNPAMGRRPQGKEQDTQHQEEHARGKLEKGRLDIVDFVPGQGLKGPFRPAEHVEDIRRAAQAAPEALDRQRLPRSYSDMARGYFENLRGPEKK